MAGNVVSSGRIVPAIRPASSRSTVTTRRRSVVLEIEVGGLTPGTQHDQLQVSGTAMLAGRLDVPIINGFVPQPGNQIVFLDAGVLTGQMIRRGLAQPGDGESRHRHSGVV